MRIEFDPTNPTEAAAVRAMLTAMHPQEWTGKTLTARFEEPTEEKVHSEDGGMTVNLTDGTITVASDATAVPETDANGEPWDARIHSTPPKLNADGTWRAKRGVKAEEIAAVRAEREAAVADEKSGPIVIQPEDFKAHVEEMTDGFATVDDSGEVVRTVSVEADPIVTAPPAPPVTTAPPAPTAAPAPLLTEAEVAIHSAPSFLDVMKAITAAQKDGKIDTAKVKELCAAVGAGESTMGLNGPDNGDKRGAFMALLASEVAA